MAGRKETISDSEILEVFSSHRDPVLTTKEVSDDIEFTLNGARKRLYKLSEKGLLDYKKAGNSPVWWITDEGKEFLESERD